MLRLYPWRFRRRYGPEMAQVFRDRLREIRALPRRGAVALFWGAVLLDLLRTAPKERVEGLIHVPWQDSGVGRDHGVLRYAARRLLTALPVLLASSVVVFLVARTTSNPLAELAGNPRVSLADRARLAHQLGLDRSGVGQYLAWFLHFLRGDWGRSVLTQTPVAKDIREALLNSAVLGAAGIALALAIGAGIGVVAALRPSSAFDNLSSGGAFLGMSIPTFWFAMLLQVLFGLYLTRWFHLSGPILYTVGMAVPGSKGFHVIDRMRHLALPALVLSIQIIAVYSRSTRASMREALQAGYLRTARGKGVRERRVLVRHALRNAVIPLSTQVAVDLGAMAGALIITEQIFQWPGMGRLFITAVSNGDYPQVLPWLMVTVGLVVAVKLLGDVVYAALDPRARLA